MGDPVTSAGPTVAARRTRAPVDARPAPSHQRGVSLALLTTVLWSTTGLFIDPLVTAHRMTPLQVSFWRALLVSVVLAPVLVWRDPAGLRLTRREVPYYVLYGLVGIGFFNVAWSTSIRVNHAAVATTLLFSAPVFVAAGARLLFAERVTGVEGGAIVVNLIGCALAAGVSHPAALVKEPDGLAWGLASGVTFAAYTLFGRGAGRLGSRGSASILFHTFAVAAVGLGLWGVVAEGSAIVRPTLEAWGWVLLAGLTFGPTLGGYACYTASLRVLPAPVASLFTTLVPLITAALAYPLLGRTLSGGQWAGLALITSGVVLMQGGTIARRGVLRSRASGRSSGETAEQGSEGAP